MSGVVPVVPVVPVSPPRPLRLGAYPAGKGMFWPTVISPSVLSVMITCGVLITFTSLELCSALSTMEKEGTVMPATVMGGPWMPARKPLSEASEATPPSEFNPPSSLPTTTGASPLTPRKETLLRTVPPCAETPRLMSFSRLTSMMTASTKTWRRRMSSRSTTLTRFR